MGERVPDGTTPPRSKGPDDSALAEDYAALEAVLNATPRGRWFLSEYARRNRRGETALLLGAMAKLEAAVVKQEHQTPSCDVLGELAAISEAIARTRREIAQIEPQQQSDTPLVSASAEFDHKLLETLCFIEQRIHAMIEMWAVDDMASGAGDITAALEMPPEAGRAEPFLQ